MIGTNLQVCSETCEDMRRCFRGEVHGMVARCLDRHESNAGSPYVREDEFHRDITRLKQPSQGRRHHWLGAWRRLQQPSLSVRCLHSMSNTSSGCAHVFGELLRLRLLGQEESADLSCSFFLLSIIISLFVKQHLSLLGDWPFSSFHQTL